MTHRYDTKKDGTTEMRSVENNTKPMNIKAKTGVLFRFQRLNTEFVSFKTSRTVTLHHNVYTLFSINNTFISNACLKLAKNQANAKQYPEAELLLFENYSHSSYALFFFCRGFLSRPFTNHRTAGEGGRHFFNSSLSLPPASQTLRH